VDVALVEVCRPVELDVLVLVAGCAHRCHHNGTVIVVSEDVEAVMRQCGQAAEHGTGRGGEQCHGFCQQRC
jgi:hypothetical protein